MFIIQVNMGVWGPTLYDSDLTNDVKDSFLKYLYSGIDGDELKKVMLQEYSEVLETNDTPFFWYAYADMAYEYGRMDEQIKSIALYYINEKCESDLFDDYGKYWKKTLGKLRNKITSDTRKKKKISLIANSSPWNVGDLHAYKLRSEYAREHDYKGKYIVLLKVGTDVWNFPSERDMNVFVIYDKIFDSIPDSEDLTGIRPIIHEKWDEAFCCREEYTDTYKHYMENIGPFLEWIMETGNVFNEKDFVYIGNINIPDRFKLEDERHAGRAFKSKLSGYEKYLLQCRDSWEGKDYY